MDDDDDRDRQLRRKQVTELKNYELPVPRDFGELMLAKASTALCVAVLALLGASQQKSVSKKNSSPCSLPDHTTSHAKECVQATRERDAKEY